MRLAIVGTRGIPARYGGFETFAEELSTRLVKRGHQVTVFGRRGLRERKEPAQYEGVSLRFAPTVWHKYLETPLAALSSLLCIRSGEYDALLVCNAANAPFCFLPKMRGIPVVINVDGIERRRGKWNWIGRSWYRFGEICSCLFGSPPLADAREIQRYYHQNYGLEPALIAYGASARPPSDTEVLSQYGLEEGRYLLYVSRLEPENNALGVVKAHAQSEVEMPLVIVGDAPYATDYINEVKAAARRNVVFTGYQFGGNYHALQQNCFAFIQATEVGGTHPALIEAMAFGNCVIANGTPENHEVLGGAGLYYDRNDFDHLSGQIALVCRDSERVKSFGKAAKRRAAKRYSWENITDQYEQLMSGVAEKSTS